MHLIGMLDSPYVRRVAVSLQLMGLPFEHESVSVFRQMERFRALNPVIKAPTLVCEDGLVLMDSGLILDHAESLQEAVRSLMPADAAERRQALRVIGLALAACEKSVQVLYETQLRPLDKQHLPWVERVTEQMLTAYRLLEAELQKQPLAAGSATINQAGVCAAVVWHFTQSVQPGLVRPEDFPALRDFSAAAEALPEFRRAPHGDSTYRAGAT